VIFDTKFASSSAFLFRES